MFNIKLPLRTCTTVQINAVFQCDIYDKNAFMKALGPFFKEPASINFCSTSEGSREQKMMKKIIVKLGRVDICFMFVDFYCHWLSKFCSRSITNRVLKIVGQQHTEWKVASRLGQEIQRFVFSEYHRFWNHDLPHQFRCNQETVCSKCRIFQ